MRLAGPVLLAVLLAAACAEEGAEPAPTREEAIPPGAVKMTPADDAHPPVMHSAEWEEPVPLGPPVNTAGAEDSPFITPDGQTLYFFFTPDASIPVELQVLDGVTGIWAAERSGDGWGEPYRVVLSDPGEPAMDGCGFVQGETIWFCSVRAGNLREIDFYTAQRRDGVWTGLENAGELLNVEYQMGEMHLSADGTEIYYHTTALPGPGDMDIWVTRMVDGEWAPPEPVTAVNTAAREGWPFLSEDGAELWFLRVHEGSPAVLRSIRDGADWGEPELIVSRFAGEPTLDAAGNLFFVHHYVEDGEIIEADIYVAHKR